MGPRVPNATQDIIPMNWVQQNAKCVHRVITRAPQDKQVVLNVHLVNPPLRGHRQKKRNAKSASIRISIVPTILTFQEAASANIKRVKKENLLLVVTKNAKVYRKIHAINLRCIHVLRNVDNSRKSKLFDQTWIQVIFKRRFTGGIGGDDGEFW